MTTETYVPLTCPSEETLFEFLDGELDAVSQVEILRHLSTCERCRQALADAAVLFTEVSCALKASGPLEAEVEEGLDDRLDDVVAELKASRVVVQRKRLDVKAIARQVGRGAVKGATVATTSLVSGARLAYSGARYLAEKKSKVSSTYAAVTKVTGTLGQWRLAW